MSTRQASSSSSAKMKCVSCLEDYDARDIGTCKECYKEANDMTRPKNLRPEGRIENGTGLANETEEELKREIDNLKFKVSFLKFLSPLSFPDVVLVGSADSSFTVPAHKAVLASCSPVFRAMLENQMEESLSGTIKIGDVSFEALRAFVKYLYTAETCVHEEMACHVLILAEKYQVQHLKDYCERFLVSQLNWDNSIMNYTFAHQHNAKHIVDAALTLITDNMDKLPVPEEYMELVQKDPRLVVEIYEAYLSKQNNTAAQKDPSG